jgi:hypothetical protein
MGSHLGWHFAVCCPLRGSRGEFIFKKHQKQLRKKKDIEASTTERPKHTMAIPIYCTLLFTRKKDSKIPYL